MADGRRIGAKLFLTVWVVYALHSMVFVAREHYPALALIERGDFRVDDYARGYHWDIFTHKDGHAYIGNQVLGSVIVAAALWPFAPVLERLEAWERAHPLPSTRGSTEYRLRGDFRERAREDGRLLKLGAAAAISGVFTMAPLAALLVTLVHGRLRRHGVAPRRALLLALLLAFGTPLFFRAAPVTQNFFLLLAAYGAAAVLWPAPGAPFAPSAGRRLASGVFGGACLALDYAGIVPLLVVFAYLVLARRKVAGLGRATAESLLYVLGAVPPVAFLWWSQWWMFGHPFFPGQHWMPQDQNALVQTGFHGFHWPSARIAWRSLVDPSYGLYTNGPILVLGLVPAFYAAGRLVHPRRERRLAAAFFAALLLFTAANAYVPMQINSGLRYLLPLVPFIFWQASDHLVRLREWALWALMVPAILHSWVLAMWRFTVPRDDDPRTIVGEAWRRFAEHGVTFPWLETLREVAAVRERAPWIGWAAVPLGILGALALGLVLLWRPRTRAKARAPVLPTMDVDGPERLP